MAMYGVTTPIGITAVLPPAFMIIVFISIPKGYGETFPVTRTIILCAILWVPLQVIIRVITHCIIYTDYRLLSLFYTPFLCVITIHITNHEPIRTHCVSHDATTIR